MRTTITILIAAALGLGGLVWRQRTEISRLRADVQGLNRELKNRTVACQHLADEVRSAVRLNDDHEMEVTDNGTITIFHKLTAARWEFPPDGLRYSVYMPTR